MGSLTNLYNSNLGMLLQALQQHDGLARYELAELTGLTRASVSNSISELINKGIVHEVEHGAASIRGGRKPILLKICKNALAKIGIDLRREKISGCLINLLGDVIKQVSYPIPLNAAAETIWDTFNTVIGDLKRDQAIPITGIGIGSVGPLNVAEGKLTNPTDFKSMKNALICDVLQEKHNVPVMLQIGAGAAALGEYFWAKRGISRLRSLAFIVIDYGGIGLGMISDGTLVNNDGSTAELGHVTIDYEGRSCECGRRGCLRKYASGKTLLESVTMEGKHVLSDLTLSTVARQAKLGDKALQASIVNAGKYLAHGVLDVDRMLSPERIVIGSSHECLEGWYLRGVRQCLETMGGNADYLELSNRVSLAAKGSYTIAYGAATMQIKKFYECPLATMNRL